MAALIFSILTAGIVVVVVVVVAFASASVSVDLLI